MVAHRKYYGFFTVLLLLINFLAHTLLDGNPTTLNAAIAFMVAYIKTSQFTAETTTCCRRTTAPPFIPYAQNGSLGTASWAPNPREPTGQLLAGKHLCNYSAWSLRVKNPPTYHKQHSHMLQSCSAGISLLPFLPPLPGNSQSLVKSILEFHFLFTDMKDVFTSYKDAQ